VQTYDQALGMTTRFGIVADDLTGACDAALEFFNNGYTALVRVTNSIQADAAQVISINTDSRYRSVTEAYNCTFAAVKGLQAIGTRTIYKKIDSALRGNIGVELQAVHDAAQAEAIVIAPSLPNAGRSLEQGTLIINGEPLGASAIGQEQKRRTSNAAEIIAETMQLPVTNLDLQTVRSEESQLARHLQTAVAQGFRLILVDAVTDNDLDAIATALLEQPRWCGAGSAGLAAAISRQLPISKTTASRGTCKKVNAPVLGVIGSQHPMARIQIDWLEKHHQAQIVRLESDSAQQMLHVKHVIEEKLRQGQNLVLTAELGTPCDARKAHTMAHAMGEIVAALEPKFAGLVLGGGDTAQGVLCALNVESAHVLAEVEPGMPALVLRGGLYPGMPVVTKAGSFGSPASLGAAFEFIQRI
jgi:uncharacterized protein YgbK (DUF1537 family)